MFADGIEQAGEQEFAGRLGTLQKTGDEMIGSAAFPFLARKARRIDEGALRLFAGEEAFFEEAIESGHDGGVGEVARDLANYVADVVGAVSPKNIHQFEFEVAEGQGIGGDARAKEAVLKEANHGAPSRADTGIGRL